MHDLRHNQRKLLLICRDKGEKELRARSLLGKRQELARRYEKEFKDADDWLKLCTRVTEKKFRLKKKVTTDAHFIDIDSINGHWQRLQTVQLQKALLEIYFKRIIESIISRAESIASERRLLNIQENLTRNKLAVSKRIQLMRGLQNEIKRDNLLRMKRSALNKILFPRTRANLLQNVFGGWVRFFLWNRGHREAFELKYEVLKTRMEVDRKYRSSNVVEPITSTSQDPTLMQHHRERPVQCRNCKMHYIESQNTSLSCRYHIGEFKFCCPANCEDPGKSRHCIVHKIRRWSCCDSTNESVEGCCQKYHIADEIDPIYSKLLRSIREKNAGVLESLNAKYEEITREQNWVKLNDVQKKKHFDVIAEGLAKDRDTVARFSSIKFD